MYEINMTHIEDEVYYIFFILFSYYRPPRFLHASFSAYGTSRTLKPSGKVSAALLVFSVMSVLLFALLLLSLPVHILLSLPFFTSTLVLVYVDVRVRTIDMDIQHDRFGC